MTTFILDGAPHTACDQCPETTVLEYLRQTLHRTGTKEVVLLEIAEHALSYWPRRWRGKTYVTGVSTRA